MERLQPGFAGRKATIIWSWPDKGGRAPRRSHSVHSAAFDGAATARRAARHGLQRARVLCLILECTPGSTRRFGRDSMAGRGKGRFGEIPFLPALVGKTRLWGSLRPKASNGAP